MIVYKKLLDAFNYLKPALQSYSPSNDALKQTFAQNILVLQYCKIFIQMSNKIWIQIIETLIENMDLIYIVYIYTSQHLKWITTFHQVVLKLKCVLVLEQL